MARKYHNIPRQTHSLLIKRLTLYPKHTRILLTQVVEKNLGEHFTIIAEYLLSEMEGCLTSEVKIF